MDDVPNLALLRLFDAIYRERHLTRAAHKLGTSQPTLSRSLRELRTLFDDPLFVRTTGGLSPTPRADELAPEVDALIEQARALVTRARFDPQQLARTFVVATTDLIEQYMIVGLVAALAKQAPRVDIVFRKSVGDFGEMLATGSADLVVAPKVSLPGTAISMAILYDTYLCAVRRGHPAAKRKLSVAAYAALSHVQIAPSAIPGGPVDDALAKRGLTRRVAVRTPSFLVAPLVAARTDLILTAPTRLLAPTAKAFGLVTFPPPLPVPGFRVYQGWHPRVQRDPAHMWFRNLFAETARAEVAFGP